MIVVGVDPGLTGALSMLGHRAELLHLEDMPVMQRGDGSGAVKNQVNCSALSELLREWLDPYDKNQIHVFIEQAQSMPAVIKGKVVQGGASIFSTGLTAGMIEGVVASRGYPHTLVRPAEWKKVFKLKSAKEQARALAQRMYPEASLHRMKDHDRAESLLIAKYGFDKVA